MENDEGKEQELETMLQAALASDKVEELEAAVECAVAIGADRKPGQLKKQYRLARSRAEALRDEELRRVGEEEHETRARVSSQSPEPDAKKSKASLQALAAVPRPVHRPPGRPKANSGTTEYPAEQPAWVGALLDMQTEKITNDLTKRITELSLAQKCTDVKVARHEMDITGLKEEQAAIKTEVQKLAAQVSSGAASSGGFQPSFLDVRGACTFDQVEIDGFSEAVAQELQGKLFGTLREEAKTAISNFELGGVPSFFVRFRFTGPKFVAEAADGFRRLLRKPENHYAPPSGASARELFVTFEKSECEKVRYRSYGELKELVEEIIGGQAFGGEGHITFKWKPKFAVISQHAELVAKVSPAGELIVGDSGIVQRVLGMTSAELRTRYGQRN
jgi:hypothetical protein